MDDKLRKIKKHISDSIDTKNQIKDNIVFHDIIIDIVEKIVFCYKSGGKVLFCGNGGSAADAQHLSAELSGRFKKDRKPLHSDALHVNTSYLTAVANDYSYDEVYSRLVEAQGRSGDILVAISTSGTSTNVLNAVEMAKSLDMVTVCFTGHLGKPLSTICDFVLNVPSEDTAVIQESHIMIGHIICDLVESSLFS